MPVVNIQDRLREIMHEAAGEIEGRIDDFVLSGCKDDNIRAFAYLKEINLPQVQAAKMPQLFARVMQELEEAIEGKDPQLKEGYSNFTKIEFLVYSVLRSLHLAIILSVPSKASTAIICFCATTTD